MMKKNIFIAYTNTGMGHKVPAFAIAEMIEKLYPNQYNIICSNFFDDVGEVKFNTFIEKSWDLMLTYPILTKSVQFFAFFTNFLTHLYLPIGHRNVWKKSMAYLKELNPDIVFSTHFFPQTIAIDAREKYNLNYSIITLNPDTFETFPFWDKRGDFFLVCSDVAKKQAIKWGHDPKKIRIMPPALRETFDHTKIDKDQVIENYQIRRNVFTILMTDGGQGVGRMFPSIKRLIKLNKEINIIAVCAKNENLYHKLVLLKNHLKEKNSPIQLIVLGFIENVQELIVVSDLFIGKSGPATILECLKMKLPVLVNFSANTAERNVVRFFKKQGVLTTSDIYRLPYKVARILDDSESLQKIKDKINTIDSIKNGSKKIANFIVSQISQ